MNTFIKIPTPLLIPFLGWSTNAVADGVDYEETIQELLNDRCVYCHMEGAAQGGLNLEPGFSLENLVSVPSTESQLLRVHPGSTEKSYLWHKLLGTHIEVGGTGLQMPMAQSPITGADLEAIEQWILNLPASSSQESQ